MQVIRIEVYEDSRSLLKANGGTVSPVSKYDNATGTATVEVATATGDPPGVSGTGAIALVSFKGLQAGQWEVTFDSISEIREPNNVTVTLAEKVAAVVEVL